MWSKPTERSWTNGAIFGSIGKAMDQSLIASVKAAERILLQKGPPKYPPTAVYQVPYGYIVQQTTHIGVSHVAPYIQSVAPPPGFVGPSYYEPPPPYPGPSNSKSIGAPPPYRPF